MSHDEWVLHRNMDYTVKLLEYVETRIACADYKLAEYLHDALVELGAHIDSELDKYHN